MTPDECCLKVHSAIRRHVGNTVKYGPFADMVMPPHGNRFYYVLGTYELELHPILHRIGALCFKTIVNVGACDGYYAIGLARSHPEARVVAFEAKDTAQGYLRLIAEANHVEDRIEIRGKCLLGNLADSVGDGEDCLVVMDCEGDENVLLNPGAVPALRNCHILAELHENEHEGIVKNIWDRFHGSHAITGAMSHPRRFNELPFQPEASDSTEELIPYWISTLEENRPIDMTWYYMEPTKC